MLHQHSGRLRGLVEHTPECGNETFIVLMQRQLIQ